MPQLKVLRTQDAKQFPLIQIKKHGDVGYDLPIVLPYKEIFKDEETRNIFVSEFDNGFAPIEMLEVNMRETWTLQPQCRVLVPTGIKLELPDGYWASIEARSSTSKQMLIVPKGVIDEGYRGELFAQIINVGTTPVDIKHGDRLVQLIIHKRNDIEIIEVDELSESERGETGFGSTGQSAINT